MTFAQLQAVWTRLTGLLLYDVKGAHIGSVLFAVYPGLPAVNLTEDVTESEFNTAFPGFTIKVESVT